MTGRSNSATTSRKMWMLSASSARRWSSRKSVVTSGDKATVDIHVNHEGTKRSKATKTNVFLRELRSASCSSCIKKARDFVPGFVFSSVFLVVTQIAELRAPGPMGSSYNKRRYSSNLRETLPVILPQNPTRLVRLG